MKITLIILGLVIFSQAVTLRRHEDFAHESLHEKKSKPVITKAQYIDTPDAEAITESDEIP